MMRKVWLASSVIFLSHVLFSLVEHVFIMRAYISTVITTRLEMLQMTKELHFNVQILSGRYNVFGIKKSHHREQRLDCMFIWHQNVSEYTETQLLHKNAMGNLTNYLVLSLIIAKLEMTQNNLE